jgi:LytS/YehU family sensor histidine kinase
MINLNEKALEKFIEADKILSQSDLIEHHILSKADMALIYTRTEQYQQALDIYLIIEREMIAMPIGIRHAQIYVNIDAAYVYLKDYSNALRYSLKALEIVERENHAFGKAISYVNIGGNYVQLGEIEKAKEFIDKAHQLLVENDIESLRCSINLKYAEYFAKISDYKQAIEYGNKALKFAEEQKSEEQAMFVCGRLIEFNEQFEDYKQALSMSKKYNEMKQAALAREKMNVLNSLQLQYNTEKKELELSELKVKQQELEIEKRDSELSALKSQMNPHFIFNALNSIQELYTIGDKKMANEQMGNFAQLTRKILDVSGKQKIELAEEIEILTKYLELECMRFENDFSYKIHLSDNLDEDYTTLPPMLIQPYVENSIKHGLLHKKGSKQLDIYFELDEDANVLKCSVDDNGIGRKASAELNKNRSASHVSFSTSATEKRLRLLNQGKEEVIAVQFEDKEDESGNTSGTRVIIQIPV